MGIGVDGHSRKDDGRVGERKAGRKDAQHSMFLGGKWLGMPLTDLAQRLGVRLPTGSVAVKRRSEIGTAKSWTSQCLNVRPLILLFLFLPSSGPAEGSGLQETVRQIFRRSGLDNQDRYVKFTDLISY
jgi:hypothetical protein